MKIECRQQKASKKKRVSSSYYLTPRLLAASQMTLVTIGGIILTYLIAISLTEKSNSQASAAKINQYKFSSELANKRQLIVALQSIRMHNVTRYQRKTEQKLEQPPLSLSKTNDTADDLSRISSALILNRNNVNNSASFAASVTPVQQGW
ncbi:hypothetical protein [Brumicola nitratireducens]|uniref:Uncharacterized protein n=1 Tax=Glaciecola nitratireducens (strain JCM 12485 / KCTC 12276 / FR1064) TaxID=1085623 RepID=G4QGJ3_GLANF|nr:hypothetical protein [Glaciecola nitratireducens]AEP29630.1 hypothetical protein GNIT_1512 [Glaciecola nitratireducens FR1064]